MNIFSACSAVIGSVNLSRGFIFFSNDERKKRQLAYEMAKKNSERRGVPLTQETEAIMRKYINGEISDLDFFNHVTKMAKMELMPPAHLH